MSFDKIKPYLLIGIVIGIAIWFRQFAPAFTHLLHEGTEKHVAPYVGPLGVIAFSVIAGVVLVRKTVFPREMLFLVFGIILAPYMDSLRLVTAGALIYFAGNVLMKAGLGIKFSDFWKTLIVTSFLSVVTLFVTAFLFSAGQYYVLGPLLGVEVNAISANLTGALLASTDPAALIPLMAGLTWIWPRARDIVLTESGLTDVTGALLVAMFIPMSLTGVLLGVWGTAGYGAVFSHEAASILGGQVGWAIVGALAGAATLYCLQVLREIEVQGDNATLRNILKLKSSREPKEAGAPEEDDATLYDIWAFVLAFAVAFCTASVFGGNVFLSCFGAGLALAAEKHFEHGQHAYDEKIEGLYIPPIFVMGGSLVAWGPFVDLFQLGLLSAVLLIFVRYMAAYFGLSIPMYFKLITRKEVDYFASVRQVGAIGLVLASVIAALKIPGTDLKLPGVELVLPVTAWVAIFTLGFCGWWSTRTAINKGLAVKK